ncbi:MAG: hypothetical protein ACREUQ_03330 [Burkholderiales bacterium]
MEKGTWAMKPPGMHCYGSGWMLCEIAGKEAFSDGHAAFVGKPRGKSCKLPDGHMKAALKMGWMKRLIPTEFEREETIIGGTKIVVLKKGTAIQQSYYAYVQKHFKQARMYLGKRIKGTRGLRYVYVIQKDKSVAGMIMPIEYKREQI